MENFILLLFLLILFVIPFTYIIVVDIIEISKRFHELFNLRLKPAVISVVNSMLN